MYENRGIVLKHYAPHKNTCIVIDESLGRITGLLIHDRLSTGTLIQYRISQKRAWYCFDSVDMLHIPSVTASHELLFLHYVFEMCYYFLPEGVASLQIYSLLSYIIEQHSISIEYKKKILCLLIALLELYPDNAVHASAQLYAMAQAPLNQVFKEDIDATIEKNIVGWLYQSVRSHMGIRQFKTIHFLDEIS
jgi:hypothetical protein